ncbi:MAG: hypothetical protein F6K08_32880 [Okeania sp. SIO1H6]|uniref:hypothetical protein n=1 Tax=Okeania TaxID=1458928 RepID=UPI000F520328|nr:MULTISPECIES: hypothetical protein [unclassified Okeania]NEP74966.1 hypothetical protein [Okeania sp. SIO2G5]NET17270.1 hypothetical protein [Okeania sp. SIO1H6]
MIFKKRSVVSRQQSSVSSKRLEGECYPSAHLPVYRNWGYFTQVGANGYSPLQADSCLHSILVGKCAQANS